MRINRFNILLSSAMTVAAVLAGSCAKEETPGNDVASSCENLIGQKVNFCPHLSEFVDANTDVATKGKTTNNYDGSFNEEDQMTVYRQYWNGSDFDTTRNSYRIYVYELRSELGWIINVGDEGKEGENGYFTQKREDLLTWQNSQTVRFRAYSRSNLKGVIDRSTYCQSCYYYPDYSVSAWVNSSGPSMDVPFYLEHLGCRIAFNPINEGNTLAKVEICTDPADYMWEDNADTGAHDESDKADAATAQKRADSVAAVYNRMCMPSGVNISSGKLYALTKDYYDTHSSCMTDVDNEKETAAHVKFGQLDSAGIRTAVQRPVFTQPIREVCYLISIPYDFSSHMDVQGEQLILPPYTRFRVYLYDVNNADQSTVGSAGSIEKTYHIFSLSDIKDGDEQVFPDGLALKAGRSYWFDVGYRYGELEIKLRDNLSWSRQDEVSGDATDNTAAAPASEYSWWQTTMNTAAETALTSGSYNPEFELSDVSRFASFIQIVNGTATSKTGTELKSAFTQKDSKSVTGWYTTITAEGDTVWLRRGGEDESSPGLSSEYIFYDRYLPQNGNVPAHIREFYLTTSGYSFYDSDVDKRFTVSLTSSLDLKDIALTSIGTDTNPFKGCFEGNAKTLSNVYMTGGYLFGYIDGGEVADLFITSGHSTSLINKAAGSTYIAGISLNAGSDKPAFANEVLSGGSLHIAGCINYGHSGRALIGTNNGYVLMYGCMQTSEGITGGALCESDVTGVLKPQIGEDVVWGNFMCNYYDITRSPDAKVSGAYSYSSYRPQEYIRGAKSYVLKAWCDLGLPESGSWKEAYYGIAPWKAMNSAIIVYNANFDGRCRMHYKQKTAYDNLYPELAGGVPSSSDYVDVTEEPN